MVLPITQGALLDLLCFPFFVIYLTPDGTFAGSTPGSSFVQDAIHIKIKVLFVFKDAAARPAEWPFGNSLPDSDPVANIVRILRRFPGSCSCRSFRKRNRGPNGPPASLLTQLRAVDRVMCYLVYVIPKKSCK